MIVATSGLLQNVFTIYYSSVNIRGEPFLLQHCYRMCLQFGDITMQN
jgi:hypothetical protein